MFNSTQPPTHTARDHNPLSRTQHDRRDRSAVNVGTPINVTSDSGPTPEGREHSIHKGERPTVRAKDSFDELVRCAFEAKAVDFDQASVAVKTGLLTAEQQLLAEARFFDRYGYQHFAAQMRGAL